MNDLATSRSPSGLPPALKGDANNLAKLATSRMAPPDGPRPGWPRMARTSRMARMAADGPLATSRMARMAARMAGRSGCAGHDPVEH